MATSLQGCTLGLFSLQGFYRLETLEEVSWEGRREQLPSCVMISNNASDERSWPYTAG